MVSQLDKRINFALQKNPRRIVRALGALGGIGRAVELGFRDKVDLLSDSHSIDPILLSQFYCEHHRRVAAPRDFKSFGNF